MEKLLTGHELTHRQAVRLQIVLNRADGRRTSELSQVLHVHPVTISQVVGRFNESGLEGLLEVANRKPGKPPMAQKTVERILELAGGEPPIATTHWSTREIAKRVGVSHTAVHAVLRAHGLKPHLVKRFRRSNDPQFKEKLIDVVGLYLNPPENAIVLCLDEKSQIQALERTQPILPLRPGIPERQTHDYQRHGVTTLYAALEVASGSVIGDCQDRHRHQEYLAFLRLLDRQCEAGKVVHLIVDNVSSHKTAAVKEFLKKHEKRFVVHYTPTHASWLNLVERWFAEITTKRIRRGSWNSLVELKRAIYEYIRHWNASGRKLTWTKGASEILASTRKATRD